MGDKGEATPKRKETEKEGAAAAGAGGSKASGGGVTRRAGWIDPNLLDQEFKEGVCGLCKGVMEEPMIGILGEHSFCKPCYKKALGSDAALERNQDLERKISRMRLRCPQYNYVPPVEEEKGTVAAGTPAEGDKGNGAGPPAAKRPKLTAATSMTQDELKKELRSRNQSTSGENPELVARLEKDRKRDSGCRWKGTVGQFSAHMGECGLALIQCPNEGCAVTRLRKEMAEHSQTCEHRVHKCRHCEKKLSSKMLAEHEGRCPSAKIKCPNKGCNDEQQRRWINLHRAKCQHEEVACPCPGCTSRLLRRVMDSHVEATHLKQGAAKLVQSLWNENARLKAASKSEQNLLATEPTSWVFNWRADGWGDGFFESETHDFGGGVTGSAVLQPSSSPDLTHHLGYLIKGLDKCRVHVTVSILDKYDKVLRQVFEHGTATEPKELDFKVSPVWGVGFTPTVDEKTKSVRPDKSIRLRAVVCLFLDGAAKA